MAHPQNCSQTTVSPPAAAAAAAAPPWPPSGPSIIPLPWKWNQWHCSQKHRWPNKHGPNISRGRIQNTPCWCWSPTSQQCPQPHSAPPEDVSFTLLDFLHEYIPSQGATATQSWDPQQVPPQHHPPPLHSHSCSSDSAAAAIAIAVIRVISARGSVKMEK